MKKKSLLDILLAAILLIVAVLPMTAFAMEAPMKISDILPVDFPTKISAAWTAADGVTIYNGNGSLWLNDASSGSGNGNFPVNGTVTPDGGNYIYDKDSDNKIQFIMKDGTLQSIIVTGKNPYGNHFAGTYLPSVKVTFDLQSHGNAINPVTVRSGSTIQAPTAPIAAGYVFGGWFKEAACTNEWIFNTDIVTEKTILYAKWTVHTHDFTYSKEGASLYASCGGAGTCTLTNSKLTVTVVAENASYTGYNYTGAELTGDTANWKTETGLNLPQITYQNSSEETIIAPEEGGTYFAVITVDGVTAKQEFLIDLADPEVTITRDLSKPYNGYAVLPPSASFLGGGEMKKEYKLKSQDDTAYTTEQPVDAGEYTYRLSVGQYLTRYYASSATKDFTIYKATPTLIEDPVASAIADGETLAQSTLTGGELQAKIKGSNTTIAGTFSWDDDSTVVTAADSESTEFDVIFTPTDTKNFESVECKVKLKVYKKFIVSFRGNGGTTPTDQEIVEGQKATEPTDPTRTNFAFTGWFTDEACQNKFDFDTAITADTVLYAGWESTLLPITTLDISMATILTEGKPLPSEPVIDPAANIKLESLYFIATDNGDTDPATMKAGDKGSILIGLWAKDGYEFKNDGHACVLESVKVDGKPLAFKDPDITYDYATPVDVYSSARFDLIELYVSYTVQPMETFTVSFETNGGDSVTSQTVKKDEKAVKPNDPKKAGYTFAGWYSDKELQKIFDFSTAITADTIVYAKWTQGIVPVTGVNLEKTSLSMMLSGTETLKATVEPSNATDKTVIWKSSDYSVATTDENGKVIAVGKGTATITATTADGGKTAECTVTVDEMSYKIIQGANQTIYTDATEATFASDAEYDKFLGIQIDGKSIVKSAITVKPGSTIVILSRKIIKSLSVGTHTLTILSKDGSATTHFLVKKPLPKTGDSSSIALWSILLLAALGTIVFVLKKQRKHN